jgi:TRAP transporter TAXI family solute receptor
MKSFRFLLSVVLSLLLLTGDGLLFGQLFAKSRAGGSSRSYSSGYSKPSFGSGSNWSGTTKGTWDRSGGGILGGSSSGYSKPSTLPHSSPGGNLGGSGYSKPGDGGYSKPSFGFGSGPSGYSRPNVGTTPKTGSSESGYNKPTLRDTPGTIFPQPFTYKAPTSSGYSKPSASGSGTQGGSSGSSSGGYTKPSSPGIAAQKPSGLSGLDQRAINEDRKRRSQESFQRYNAEQSKFKNPPAATNQDYSSNPIYQKSKNYSGFDYNTHYNQRDSWFRGMGYSPPGFAFGGSPSFGIFNALFLYWMLDHMHDKNVAHSAYNNWDDPGFKKWREEVEKQSKDNAELKSKLQEMEKQVDQFKGQPKQPGTLPPNVPPEVAIAPDVLASKPAEKPLLRFGTGRQGGIYDKFGTLLKNSANNINVEIQTTNGSIDNLKLLAENKLDMAIVQSDVLALMQPGKKLVSEQASLYTEYAQLIANRHSGIKSVKDLNPKKHVVFVGPKGSGTALTWQGIADQSSFYRKLPVKYGEYTDGLAEVERNQNVVMLFVGGLNSDFLKKAEKDAEKSGNLRLVEFDDRRFASRQDDHGNVIYKFMEIPRSAYPELQRGWFFSGSVETLAVQAVLVLRTDWAKDHGPEAMDELSAAINKAKPEIQQLVNAK